MIERSLASGRPLHQELRALALARVAPPDLLEAAASDLEAGRMADGLRRLESLGLDPLVAEVAASHPRHAAAVARQVARMPPLELLLLPTRAALSYAAVFFAQTPVIAAAVLLKISPVFARTNTGIQTGLAWFSVAVAILLLLASVRRLQPLFYRPVASALSRARRFSAAAALGPDAAILLRATEPVVGTGAGTLALEELAAEHLRHAERLARGFVQAIRIGGTVLAVLVAAGFAATTYLPIFHHGLTFLE